MKFIRKGGRIIPIKEKGEKKEKLKGSERSITQKNSKGQSVKVTVQDKSTTALGRFNSAFKSVAPVTGAIGAVFGGLSGLEQAKSGKQALAFGALGALAGGVSGAVTWGTAVGGLNALVGARKITVVKSVEVKGLKLKKKKGSSV